MTIGTYNRGIPNAPNNPSADQPLMQINTNSIQDLIGIDHAGFNNASTQGGYHNRSSYIAQAADPGALAGIEQIYGKKTSGNNVDLYIRNASDATNNASAITQLTNTRFSPSAANPGISYLPGGLIVQWRFQNGPFAIGTTIITFPTAFPNNCFTVVATPVKSGSISNLAFSISTTPTTTTFTIVVAGTTLDSLTYYAIGN